MAMTLSQHSAASVEGTRPDQARIDEALRALRQSETEFSWTRRQQLLAGILEGVALESREWVEAACRAKRIPGESPFRAEEVTAGPLSVLRYLRLMMQTAAGMEQAGRPSLPRKPYRTSSGSWRVPIFPARGLYDSVLFAGLSAEAWMDTSFDPDHPCMEQGDQAPASTPRIVLILGAGNVSAIPATDALTKIFQQGRRVLLKMNPVNAYLTPRFERAFAPLIDSGWLRIVGGGAEAGQYAMAHSDVEEVHITGSTATHQAIVWGGDSAERERRIATDSPRLTKPITSELGNVSPWIMVPGRYTRSELQFQAAGVAASITNNASFNCLATKVIVTYREWPQREEFLGLVESALEATPRRYAYYPGARERWERFAGARPPEDPALPWKLIRDADPGNAAHLFEEESFVCVCAETALPADSPSQFLERAVAFVNDRCQGTLCAAVTVPSEFHRQNSDQFQSSLARLRYGAIGVNHWPGLLYALMTPPWGGYPGATLADPQSGIGSVHNTYLLKNVEKTVLRGPLKLFPKPMWFAAHKRPETVAWRLFDLYHRPSPVKLIPLIAAAMRG